MKWLADTAMGFAQAVGDRRGGYKIVGIPPGHFKKQCLKKSLLADR